MRQNRAFRAILVVVEYDEIAARYFASAGADSVVPTVPNSPARRLRDALEPIATQGWWSRTVANNMDALGLDFFGAYVWGRAASLGNPSPSTVISSFGVMEPSFLSGIYLATHGKVSRETILASRADGAARAIELVCTPAQAEVISAPLRRAMDVIDGCARPLFAGLRELSAPTTPQGQLWRLAEMFREHRGDGHLAVCIAHGLSAIEANIITELWLGYDLGDYSTSRGFSMDALKLSHSALQERGITNGSALTSAGYSLRLQIERDTDRTQDHLVSALGTSIDTLIDRANEISTRILNFPSFPSDPRKRAAG